VDLMPALFDPDGRLRRQVRRQVISELRCRPSDPQHLLAVAIRTVHGSWVGWKAGDWSCAWADEAPGEALVRCPCWQSPRPVAVAALEKSAGTVFFPRVANPLPREELR
jgi:hypothetical protein